MSTFDTGPVLEGWAPTIRYHCGQVCEGRDCPVCGIDAILHPQIPPNVELGTD
jgi:hypothetical protein